MKTSNIACVVRPVGKGTQWVSANGRQDLVIGEPTKVGAFNSFTVATGPSNSHDITCYEPIAGETSDGVVSSFVVRLVGKQQEYVPAAGRVDLVEGETLITGCAVVAAHIKDGPSGSNSVAVFRFVGTPSYGKVSTRSTDGRSEVNTNAGAEAALVAA